MNKHLKEGLLVLMGAVIVVPMIATAAQWAGPNATPPGANKETPIHVGSGTQIKIGGITAGNSTSFGVRTTDSNFTANRAGQSNWGLYTPGKVGAGGFCFDNDCRYSWSEIGGGGGGGDSWQGVSGRPNWIEPKDSKGVQTTNGFVLQSLSSNPTELIAGRMWYCTGTCPTSPN